MDLFLLSLALLDLIAASIIILNLSDNIFFVIVGFLLLIKGFWSLAAVF